jgi:hypothetical protein
MSGNKLDVEKAAGDDVNCETCLDYKTVRGGDEGLDAVDCPSCPPTPEASPEGEGLPETEELRIALVEILDITNSFTGPNARSQAQRLNDIAEKVRQTFARARLTSPGAARGEDTHLAKALRDNEQLSQAVDLGIEALQRFHLSQPREWTAETIRDAPEGVYYLDRTVSGNWPDRNLYPKDGIIAIWPDRGGKAFGPIPQPKEQG